MTRCRCCALRRGLRRNTCRSCLGRQGAGPGPSTIALVTSGAAAHCSLSRPWEVKPAVCMGVERRVPTAERSPGSPWGGDGVAGAPPLTRLATQRAGNPEPGFSKRMPSSARAYRRVPYILSREHRLACGGCREATWLGYGSSPSPPPSTPLARARRGPRTRRPRPAQRESLPGRLVNPRGTDFTLSHRVRSRPFLHFCGACPAL